MHTTHISTSLDRESFSALSTKICQKTGIGRADWMMRFCRATLAAIAVLSLPCRLLSADCSCGVPVYLDVGNAGTMDWGGCSVGNPIYGCDPLGNGGTSLSDGGIGELGIGQRILLGPYYQPPFSSSDWTVRLPYNCGSVPAPSPPMHVVPLLTECGDCYSPKSERLIIYIWPGGKPINDDNDRPPDCEGSGCNTCGVIGMPVWGVSQPYINLWISDEPLGYQPAIGPRVSFTLNYNQRELISGVDPNIFSVGRKWSFPWLSYVAKDPNANNVVYLPGGGSITFTNAADFLTNTRLTGDTTNG